MPILNTITCLECGEFRRCYGKQFCSPVCRNRNRNRVDNPSRRPEVRAKKSIEMKAVGQRACLMTSEARTKAAISIAAALVGKKQSSDHVASRANGWKAAAKKRGGMSDAHKKQLARIQKEHSGPNHPNWQGGTSTERNKEYRTDEYKAYRQAVLIRDDYTCQQCGRRGGKLDVHHCHVPYAQCKDHLAILKYHPANGSTLCKPCHNKTKTTRPDLEKADLSQLPDHILKILGG